MIYRLVKVTLVEWKDSMPQRTWGTLYQKVHMNTCGETDLLFQSKNVCDRRALFEDTQHIDLIHDHMQRMPTTRGKHGGKWMHNGKILDSWYFPFHQNFRKSQNGSKIDKMLGKCPGNPKISKFLKFESFNRKHDCQDKNQMEQKFPGNNFPQIWLLWGYHVFRKFWKILFHSSLEISNFNLQTRFFGRMESARGE